RGRPRGAPRRAAGRGAVGAAVVVPEGAGPVAAGRPPVQHDRPRHPQHAGLRGADRAARPLGDRGLRARPAAQPSRAPGRRAPRSARGDAVISRTEEHRLDGSGRRWARRAGAAALVGWAGTGLLFLAGAGDGQRLLRSYLVSFAFCLSLALGGLFFVLVT